MARRDNTNHILQKLTVPTAALDAHQAQLKQALLASSQPSENNLKHTWRVLMRKKRFVIPSLATVMVAVVLVVGIMVQAQRPVSAIELTQRSLGKVSALTFEQRQALDSKLNGDAERELQAARKAKDLQVLSYEEYTKQLQSSADPSPLRGDDQSLTSLHYLIYTSADGMRHVIGVNDDNLPVIIMTSRHTGDGGQQGSVMMLRDKGGPGASAAGAPPEASMGGSTQCAMVAGNDKPVCTTGGVAPTPICQTEANGSVMCNSRQ
jgi:hypothetical protein